MRLKKLLQTKKAFVKRLRMLYEMKLLRRLFLQGILKCIALLSGKGRPNPRTKNVRSPKMKITTREEALSHIPFIGADEITKSNIKYRIPKETNHLLELGDKIESNCLAFHR